MAYLPSIDSVPSQPWAPGAPGTSFGDLAGARFPAIGRERAAMLLIHGFGEHHGRYARQITHLTERGITVHAFDLPGHGRSRGTRALVDVEGLVKPVHAGLLAVQRYARERKLPTLLFGHSMGGLLAAAVAVRVPGAVDGLFLSGPALVVGADKPGWYKQLGRGLAAIAPGFPAAKLDVENGLSRIPEYVADYQDDPLVHHGAVPGRTAATMIALADATRAQAGVITAPTVIVHGDADTLADIAGSREFATINAAAREQEWKSPDVRLVEFPDGRHELFNDTAAEDAYRELDTWLDAVAPESGAAS